MFLGARRTAALSVFCAMLLLMATAARAKVPPTSLAFQDDALLNADAGLVNRTLAQMRAHGGRGLRINAIWGQLRDSHGGYDFSKLDRLVNAARAHGIAPQLTMLGTPEYMRARNLDMALSAATPNQNLMGQFATDLAEHYRGRVKRYSVWNEPNVASFLAEGENARGAADYRHLYQAGYKGIKRVDPHAQVLLGELTSHRPDAPKNVQTLSFLRRVLAAGSKPLLADGVAIHPYQWSNPDKRAGGRDYGGISNLPAVQHELSRLFAKGRLATPKHGKVPLYLTEFGYKGAEMPAAKRAAYAKRAYELARDAHARQMLLYQWLPTTSTAMQPQNAVQVQGNATQQQDAYGRMWQRPGAFSLIHPPARTVVTHGGPWDTSIGTSGGELSPEFDRAFRSMMTPHRIRAARARAAGKRR